MLREHRLRHVLKVDRNFIGRRIDPQEVVDETILRIGYEIRLRGRGGNFSIEQRVGAQKLLRTGGVAILKNSDDDRRVREADRQVKPVVVAWRRQNLQIRCRELFDFCETLE